MTDESEWDEIEITDEELTALALAADPNAPVDPDAVPMITHGAEHQELLPSWYMPAPDGFSRSRRRSAFAILFVVALLVVNAVGLCVTSGRLEIPFR